MKLVIRSSPLLAVKTTVNPNPKPTLGGEVANDNNFFLGATLGVLGDPTSCSNEPSPSSAYPQIGMVINIFNDDLFSPTLGEDNGAPNILSLSGAAADTCINQYDAGTATNSVNYMASSDQVSASLAVDANVDVNGWGAALKASASYKDMTQSSVNDVVRPHPNVS